MSLGVPMILMGDEVRRTQGGNNNAYCHDDETTWFDWSLVEKHADVHRFVSLLTAQAIAPRRGARAQRVSLNTFLREANKAWHGVKLNEPDWGDCSHSIALGAELRAGGAALPPHPERATGSRSTSSCPSLGDGRLVAALDRHGPRFAAGHRPLAGGAAGPGPVLSGRGPLGRDAVRGSRPGEPRGEGS